MTTAKSSQYREGPLKGVRIVEFAGIGPAPFACMLLADLGADIIRVDRAGAPDPTAKEVHLRGRPTLKLDLKSGEARETCLRLCAKADILIEGFRPGVMERLGLGPEAVRADGSEVEVRLPFRPEFAGGVEPVFVHGGIIATLCDLTGHAAAACAVRPPEMSDYPSLAPTAYRAS